jgi:hypothetical protein
MISENYTPVLSTLILSMTKTEPLERPTANEVLTQLMNLVNQNQQNIWKHGNQQKQDLGQFGKPL